MAQWGKGLLYKCETQSLGPQSHTQEAEASDLLSGLAS